MKLWVKLTLDDMVRALRAKAHDAADRVETEGRRIPVGRQPAPPKRPQEKSDAVRA